MYMIIFVTLYYAYSLWLWVTGYWSISNRDESDSTHCDDNCHSDNRLQYEVGKEIWSVEGRNQVNMLRRQEYNKVLEIEKACNLLSSKLDSMKRSCASILQELQIK